MLEVLIEALVDTLKILPVLFLAYVLIEYVEVKTSKYVETSPFLSGKYAPIVGASAGLIPQCGFSVIATDLYSKNKISMGTLLAMYIATSDEAIPILLTYPGQYKNIILILVVKFLLAVVVGYVVNFIIKKCRYSRPQFIGVMKYNDIKHISNNTIENKETKHNYFVGEVNGIDEHIGCCGHSIEQENQKHSIWGVLYHPVMHCIKIMVFILLTNIVFGYVIYFVGEDRIIDLLNATKFFQPFIAGLVGLIPNCASSVIITKLFVMGGISFGACISGLISNAGIGLAILVKQNVDRKNTLIVISTLYLVSVVAGLIMTLIV